MSLESKHHSSGDEDSQRRLLDIEEEHHASTPWHRESYWRRIWISVVTHGTQSSLLALLILSMLCNLFLSLGAWNYSERDSRPASDFSTYGWWPPAGESTMGRIDELVAGLSANRPVAQAQNMDWWGLNETLSTQLWNSLRTEHGMVALSNNFTDSRGLPRGATFPWDTSKGVYFLQAFHTLHCLVRWLAKSNFLQDMLTRGSKCFTPPSSRQDTTAAKATITGI